MIHCGKYFFNNLIDPVVIKKKTDIGFLSQMLKTILKLAEKINCLISISLSNKQI